MDIVEKTPTFNLKVVVRETGVKPHTLRAWEWRYGLPRPQRTSGGHRLYSQHDIDTVRWLLARQEEGMTISRAVELWFYLEGKNEDPLTVAAYHLEEPPAVSEVKSTLTDIREQWVASCLRFDEEMAERMLAQAFAIYPVSVVCLEVLLKGLSHIGNMWYHNKATAHQEHFASALITQRLGSLVAASPTPIRLGRVLITCPPYEDHTIALHMISLLLRYRGWEVVYLGANVPLERLEVTTDTLKPDLVVMAAQRLRTAATLLDMARFLQSRGINLAFGGFIFNLIPSLRRRIPGHFMGETIEDAVQTIGQIMTFRPNLPVIDSTPEDYRRTLVHYRHHLAQMELDVWKDMNGDGTPYEYVAATNTRLHEAIVAGLNLGGLEFVESEMYFGQQLMVNYRLPIDWQTRYFNAYYQAAHRHLNGEGGLLVNWLDKIRQIPEQSS